jgi:hypothetical protein
MSAPLRPRTWRSKAPRPKTGPRLAAIGLLGLGSAAALAGDPKVPPGPAAIREPVAILTSGLDYTVPEIAAHLARDGEGELIGWDIPGEDRFPYVATGGDTDLMRTLVKLLPSPSPLALLPVRIDPAAPLSVAQGLAFVGRTPARIVLVPFWSANRADWEPFRQAAVHFSELRIVVPACAERTAGEASPVYPRDLGVPNIVTAPAGADDPADRLISYVAGLPCLEPNTR